MCRILSVLAVALLVTHCKGKESSEKKAQSGQPAASKHSPDQGTANSRTIEIRIDDQKVADLPVSGVVGKKLTDLPVFSSVKEWHKVRGGTGDAERFSINTRVDVNKELYLANYKDMIGLTRDSSLQKVNWAGFDWIDVATSAPKKIAEDLKKDVLQFSIAGSNKTLSFSKWRDIAEDTKKARKPATQKAIEKDVILVSELLDALAPGWKGPVIFKGKDKQLSFSTSVIQSIQPALVVKFGGRKVLVLKRQEAPGQRSKKIIRTLESIEIP